MSKSRRSKITRHWRLDATCSHPAEDYVECKNGETVWKCVMCGNTRLEYHDTCSGG